MPHALLRIPSQAFALLRPVRRDALAFGLVFRLLALTVLSPTVALIARAMFALSGERAIANADLLAYALSPLGIATLLTLATLVLTVEIGGHAGTFAIACSAVDGQRMRWIDALRLVGRRAARIARIALAIVGRLLLIAVPTVLAIGAVHALWLGEHDINYYLNDQPPEFWRAVLVAGVLAAAGGALLVDRAVGYSLAIPLAIVDGLETREALRQSRSQVYREGRTRVVVALVVGPALVIACGALASVALTLAVNIAMGMVGRSLRAVAITLAVGTSLGAVLAFVTGVAAAIAAVFAVVAFRAAAPRRTEGPLSVPPAATPLVGNGGPRIGRPGALLGIAGLGVAATLSSIALLADIDTPDVVRSIAHRAGAVHATENSLSALRGAIAAGADLAEIDVQLSGDGVVVVVHDRDLMKLAGLPLRIADTPLEQLRAAELRGGEQVATLAEFCALARDNIGLCVELKYYGPDPRLAPAVLDVLRTERMLASSELMSLDLAAVRQVSELDPTVRVGALSTVALGDIARLDVDFIAIAWGAATHNLIAAAHRRGLQVYVWTLNEADSISDAIDRGVDGVITDDPPLLNQVRDERAELTDLERLHLRFGAWYGR